MQLDSHSGVTSSGVSNVPNVSFTTGDKGKDFTVKLHVGVGENINIANTQWLMNYEDPTLAASNVSRDSTDPTISSDIDGNSFIDGKIYYKLM
jgi:hypothetical protein